MKRFVSNTLLVVVFILAGLFTHTFSTAQADTLKLKMCYEGFTDEPFGLIYDSGGPEGPYGTYQNCGLMIRTRCADSIQLTFKSFYTESCCDRLYIYDDSLGTGPPLYTLAGSSLPPVLTIKGSKVFLQFISDGGVTHSGWEILWQAYFSPEVPPVANFNASSFNPPVRSEVSFTDLSTEGPSLWKWDFGDSSFDFSMNPVHIFKLPGQYDVKLVADNCYFKDSITKTITVQESPIIILPEDSIEHTINTCSDSLSFEFVVSNDGNGDLVLNFMSAVQPREETSTIHFITDGAITEHTFSDLSPAADSIYVRIHLNGDFNSSYEYATMEIDELYSIIIDDRDTITGADVYVDYIFTTPQITPWLLDGIINIRLVNSGSVSPMYGAALHEVTLEIGGSTLFTHDDSTYTVIPGDSDTIDLDFVIEGIPNGTVNSDLILYSNDSIQPGIKIPVVFEIDGAPEFYVQDTIIDMGNVRLFSSGISDFNIWNTGCDTLEIYSVISTDSSFIPNGFLNTIPPYEDAGVSVEFAPASMGIYEDSLILTGNTGTEILYLHGTGEGIPDILLDPDSIGVNLAACLDSAVIDLVIQNTGEGLLDYSIPGMSISGTGGAVFYDDFEDGDLSDWNVITGEPPMGSITDNPALGNYSLKINSSYPQTLYNQFPSDSVTYLSFNIQLDDPSVFGGAIVVHDTATNSILFVLENTGGMFNINFDSIPDPIIPDLWYYAEIKNINNQTRTFDFYLNKKLEKQSMSFFDFNFRMPGSVHVFAPTDSSASVYFDDITIGDHLAINWLSLNEATGTIDPGDSKTISLKFKGEGSPAGEYSGSMKIVTNIPGKTSVDFPVSMNLSGLPELEIRDTMIDFGNISQFVSYTDSFWIRNSGCGELITTGVSTDSGFFEILSFPEVIQGYDSLPFIIGIQADSAGVFIDTLRIQTNHVDTLLALKANVSAAPRIEIIPDTIRAVFDHTHDSIIVPVTIKNTGTSDLHYFTDPLTGTGGFAVLSLLYGVDQSREYPNTLAAIRNYFTDFINIERYITDPDVLRTWLVGKEILLIAELETGSDSVFSRFAPVLQDFVNSGGWVIFCGTIQANLLFSTGLFTGSYYNTIHPGTAYVIDSIHPMMKDIPYSFVTPNATFGYNFTNPGLNRLVTGYSSDIVCNYSLGKGQVIYIGFDFYDISYPADKIIANAFKWYYNKTGPDWIELQADSAAIPPAGEASMNVTLRSLELDAGNYNFNIEMNSDDPGFPIKELPVYLTIHGEPVLSVPDSIVDFGPLYYEYSIPDHLVINNTGNDTLFFQDVYTLTPQFYLDSFFREYVLPREHFYIPVIFRPVHPGVYSDTLYILTNGGNASIPLRGEGIEYTGLTMSHDSIYVMMGECDTMVVDIVVSNPGHDTIYYFEFHPVGYVPWITYSGGYNFISPKSEITVPVEFNSCGESPGRKEAELIIYTSDPGLDENRMPVVMEVGMGPVGRPEAAMAVDQAPCSGFADFTDISGNMPTSWFWDLGDGTTRTSESFGHLYGSPGTYTVSLRVCNSAGCDSVRKDIVIAKTTAPRVPVCEPTVFSTHFYMSTQSAVLKSVSFNTINMVEDNNSTGYDDLSCEYSTNVFTGETYVLNVVADTFSAMAWIDYNDNGIFESEEAVLNSPATYESTRTANVIIPENAVLDRPLRMRIACSVSLHTWSMDHCDTIVVGQVEDYTVNIQENPDKPPVSLFSVNVEDPCNGEVSFKDLSSGSPDNWFWSFGDGKDSDQVGPTHIYSKSGTYSVLLKVTNDFGIDSSAMDLTINKLNSEIFHAAHLVDGDPVAFTDLEGSADSYVWDFGDGDSAFTRSATHIFGDPGEFRVILTAMDYRGCKAVDSVWLTIRAADGVEDIWNEGIKLYPNPTMGLFYLEIVEFKDPWYIIEIIGPQGNLIQNKKVFNHQDHRIELDLRNYSPGYYMVRVWNRSRNVWTGSIIHSGR